MFPAWRLQLCEARAALNMGRLDRACQVLALEELKEYRQTHQLTAEVARRFVDRARQRLQQGDTQGGWHDLELAEQLASGTKGIDGLRQEYARRGLERVAADLGSGRTAAALTQLARLAQRHMGGDLRRQLAWLAEGIEQADRQLAEGKGAEALQTLNCLGEQNRLEDVTIEAGCRKGALTAIGQRIEKLRQRCQTYVSLSESLHRAMKKSDWPQVLTTADKMLALAPRDPIARRARREAWHAVGLDVTVAYRPSQKTPPVTLEQQSVRRPADRPPQPMPSEPTPHRFLLWVDAVGGFLVVTDEEVVLGQPSAESPVAVAIRADLSRRHAILRREQGNYVLQPIGPTRLDGQPITTPTVLASRHEIELGQGVRFEFTRPHALSATARLTPLSHHRTEPRADAVLLMADSCVLGKAAHCHIRSPHWTSELVLIAREGQLSCRSRDVIAVDGSEATGACQLGPTSRIEADNMGISFEPL